MRHPASMSEMIHLSAVLDNDNMDTAHYFCSFTKQFETYYKPCNSETVHTRGKVIK